MFNQISSMNQKRLLWLAWLIVWWVVAYYLLAFSTTWFIWITFACLHVICSALYFFKQTLYFIYIILFLIITHSIYSLYDFPLCNTKHKNWYPWITCECEWILKTTPFRQYCVWTPYNCNVYDYKNGWDNSIINKIDCYDSE